MKTEADFEREEYASREQDRAPHRKSMDERIEAAARVIRPDWFEHLGPDGESGLANYPGQTARQQESARQVAREAIAAAFPELSGDKPTHWLAPMLMTSEMKEAARRLERDARQGYFLRSSAWEAMRDAYLGKGDGG